MKSTLLFTLFFTVQLYAKEKIYFISHAGAGDPFWSVGYKGCTQGGKDLQANVHFLAPETPNDIARQVELLDAVIASRPDAIALTIPNDLSFSKSLKRAQQLKIPVIVVNAKPSFEDKTKNPYLAFIGMDDYQAGRKVAEKAYSSGKINSRVLIANHQPGHAGLENRQKGIEEFIKEKHIEVDKLDISSDPSAIQTMIESHLNHSPEIKTVFCLGPQCLHGIGHYFHEKKRDLYLASFDLSTFTLQLIREGIVAFSLDQQPYTQGYESVSRLLSLLRHHKPPQDLDTGMFFVTKENAHSVSELVKKGLR